MKKALKTFWNEITVSAGDPAKYKTLVKKPFRSALRYLFWLLFCISVFVTLFICTTLSVLIPHINPFLASTTADVRALYPANLIVTVEDGRLSTNSPSPTIIEFPAQWKKLIETDKAPTAVDIRMGRPYQHLITIDTKASSSDYARYHSVLLFTAHELVTPDDKTRGVRTIPFDTEKKFMLDQKTYVAFVDAMQPFLHSLPRLAIAVVILLFFVLPFILAGASWLGYLLYLALASLLALLLAKIMNRRHTYKEVYHLGLYGLTLPIFYSVISFWVPYLRIPFVFTVIFLVWMGIVFGAEKVTKSKRA